MSWFGGVIVVIGLLQYNLYKQAAKNLQKTMLAISHAVCLQKHLDTTGAAPEVQALEFKTVAAKLYMTYVEVDTDLGRPWWHLVG